MADTTRSLDEPHGPIYSSPLLRTSVRALALMLLPILLVLLLPAAALASATQGWDLVDSSNNLDYEDHTTSHGAEIESAASAFNAVGAVSAQPSSGAGTDLQIGESSLAPGVGGMTHSDGRMLFPPSKGAFPYAAVAHEFGHAEGLAHVPTGSVTDQDTSTHYEAPTPSDEKVLLDLHDSGNGGSDLDGGGDLGGGGSLFGGGPGSDSETDSGGEGLDLGDGNVDGSEIDADHKTDVSGDGGAVFGDSLASLIGGSSSGAGGGSGGGSRCSLDLGSAAANSFQSDVDGFVSCMRGGGSPDSAPGAGGPPPSYSSGSMPSGGSSPATSGFAGSEAAGSPESGRGASVPRLSDNDPEEYEGMLEDFLGQGRGSDK